MPVLRICRICLNKNVQMYQILGSEAQEVFEKITNTQIQVEKRLYFACYLCYCQLKKSQQLIIKSQKSEELLKQILLNHNELNLKSIESVDRQAYSLVNSLVVSKIELYQTQECKNIKIAIKRECDTNEVVVKDEPDDFCTYPVKVLREVDVEENYKKMSVLRICRVCLDSNVQMYQISGSEVQEVYEKLSNMQIQDEGKLYFACYLCYCQLKKSQQLVIKSQKSEELLKQILLKHNKMNLKSIECVDRRAYGLVNSLVVSNIELTQMPECRKYFRTKKQRKHDTDEVVVKDEPGDDCTDTNQECEVNGKQNFTQDEAKSIENIYGTQRNTVVKENESVPILRNGISEEVLDNNYMKYFISNDSGKKYVTIALLNKHISGCNYNMMNPKKKCMKKQKYLYNTKIKNSDASKKETHIPFKCEYCNYTCFRKSHMNVHVRIHTGEKPFKCEYCNHACSHKSNLNAHMVIHTGKKPFKCEYCNYSCTHSGALNVHIRTHTGEKPYKCEYCNYSCTHSGALKLHVRRHTGERPYKCEYCYYSCATSCSLVTHIRTHTGEKPYKCEYCYHSCKTRGALKAHIRTHTGEKLYK